MFIAFKYEKIKYLFLGGFFILAFLLPYYYASAQSAPGDFTINCEVGCSGGNNDKIDCLNKTTNPSVDFTWSQSSGATRYEVYFKTYSIGSWIGPVAVITDPNNRRYVANVGLDSNNYYYIKAINGSGFQSCGIDSYFYDIPNGTRIGVCAADNVNVDSSYDGAEANCERPPTPTPVPTATLTPTPTQPPPTQPPPTLPPPPPPGDTTAPIISNVKIINITATTATVQWDTSEPADSQVEFCRTASRCGTNTPLDSQLVSAHSVNLSGLNVSTSYYVWVKSKDGPGNLKTAGYYLFRTLTQTSGTSTPAPAPTLTPTPTPTSAASNPVVISNVQITNITRDSATVTWDTDRPADSKIYSCSFGLFCFSSLAVDSSFITSHSFNISGLRADRKYYIQAVSTDANGNRGSSSLVIFRTQPGLIVSNVRVINITQTSATVTWDTNYQADSGIISCRYFLFCFFASPVKVPALTMSHSMDLINLRAGSLYYYQAVSLDPLGYSAKSALTSFRTL